MSDEKQVVYQGEDRTLSALVKQSDGKCYDLTGATEITAKFSGGVTVTLTGAAITVVSAEGGSLDITVSDTETALMDTGTGSFEVWIDVGTDRRIVQFINALNITPKLY